MLIRMNNIYLLQIACKFFSCKETFYKVFVQFCNFVAFLLKTPNISANSHKYILVAASLGMACMQLILKKGKMYNKKCCWTWKLHAFKMNFYWYETLKKITLKYGKLLPFIIARSSWTVKVYAMKPSFAPDATQRYDTYSQTKWCNTNKVVTVLTSPFLAKIHAAATLHCLTRASSDINLHSLNLLTSLTIKYSQKNGQI